MTYIRIYVPFTKKKKCFIGDNYTCLVCSEMDGGDPSTKSYIDTKNHYGFFEIDWDKT